MSVEPPIRLISLPLFPLHQVLFPNFQVQLHIFEERYKTMIGECIAQDAPFGVVLIREGSEVGSPAEPHSVGCMARVVAAKKLEDGRMHILASCTERFRILDTMEADLPYLIGKVETISDDDTSEKGIKPLSRVVSRLFQQYIALLAECVNEPLPILELPEDPAQLSNCVAFVAQMPNLAKQRLLEMTSTRQRLSEENRLLTAMVNELESKRMLPDDSDELEQFNDDLYHPINIAEEPWQQFRKQSRN